MIQPTHSFESFVSVFSQLVMTYANSLFYILYCALFPPSWGNMWSYVTVLKLGSFMMNSNVLFARFSMCSCLTLVYYVGIQKDKTFGRNQFKFSTLPIEKTLPAPLNSHGWNEWILLSHDHCAVDSLPLSHLSAIVEQKYSCLGMVT